MTDGVLPSSYQLLPRANDPRGRRVMSESGGSCSTRGEKVLATPLTFWLSEC